MCPDFFALSMRYPDNFIMYEPTIFPAAILKIRKAKVLLFTNGKFVIVGAKDPEDFYNIVQILGEMCREVIEHKCEIVK